MIPFSDPSASYQSHKNEIDQAITRVLGSGLVRLGTRSRGRGRIRFFSWYGLHCVGVANGTDAIALALRCLGDEGWGRGYYSLPYCGRYCIRD